MSNIIAYIDTTSYTYVNGTQVAGQVWIFLKDAATGQPVNGNYASVTYFQTSNGVTTQHEVIVAGQGAPIFTGIVSDSNPASYTYNSFAAGPVVQAAVPPPYPPQNVCDLVINAISVDKPESAPGAHDAQITVQASSSNRPIEYSIDGGTNWQSSPTFTGLTGGLINVSVQDANDCTASSSATVPVLSNLLVSDPSVDLGNGNISRWNAAFNPIIFTYQRKDFEVTSVQLHTDNTRVRFNINGSLLNYGNGQYSLIASDKVYINAGNYKGIYTVDEVFGSSAILVKTTYISNASGFVNINRLRPYYYVETQVTYQSPDDGSMTTISAKNRPDSTGLIRADMSNFLQSLLVAADSSDYTQINYHDANLSASYSLQYRECWDDSTQDGHQSDLVTVAHPYYVVYAAKQLGERYGGNLAAYVPFPTLNDSSKLARWVTDFDEPAYSNGYPFDIGFIYSEAVDGLQLFCHVVPLDINRQPLAGGDTTTYLLNDDGSWLLNQDGSKFIINRASAANTGVPAQVGLNRLLISDIFPTQAYYFTIALQYTDGSSQTHTITQTQTVRIDDAVDERSVYLRWVGLSGSWNYYRFVYNQEVSLDVQNATIIKNYVTDWENQQGIEEVIAKDAGQKMKVMAEDLSVSDIKGLQSIKYSPKVQMLVNRNPVKWQTIVINTATFAEYETLNGQAPFSITFNMPSINIQTQ